MADTIFCGGGKKMKDDWLTISVNYDKIQDHIEEYKGHKFIRLNVNIKDKPNEFGKDVSVSVNTYKPDKEGKPIPKDQPVVNPPLPEKDDLEILPF